MTLAEAGWLSHSIQAFLQGTPASQAFIRRGICWVSKDGSRRDARFFMTSSIAYRAVRSISRTQQTLWKCHPDRPSPKEKILCNSTTYESFLLVIAHYFHQIAQNLQVNFVDLLPNLIEYLSNCASNSIELTVHSPELIVLIVNFCWFTE